MTTILPDHTEKTVHLHYMDDRLKLFREIIVVCYENHIRHINILWGTFKASFMQMSDAVNTLL
jgi:hypothetical protein